MVGREELGLLVLDPVAGELDHPRGLEHVAALVDAGVVAGLEVADEVHARPQRPAADVEQVMLGLEAALDEVVELELPEIVPVPDVAANRLAVPVGIEVPLVAVGQSALCRPLHRDRHDRA